VASPAAPPPGAIAVQTAAPPPPGAVPIGEPSGVQKADAAVVQGAKDLATGAWSKLNPMNMLSGLGDMAQHPIETAMHVLGAQYYSLQKAKDAYMAGKPEEAAIHLAHALEPAGFATEESEVKASTPGTRAEGIGELLGTGLGAYLSAKAPEIAQGAASAVKKLATASPTLAPSALGIISPRAGYIARFAQGLAKLYGESTDEASSAAQPPPSAAEPAVNPNAPPPLPAQPPPLPIVAPQTPPPGTMRVPSPALQSALQKPGALAAAQALQEELTPAPQEPPQAGPVPSPQPGLAGATARVPAAAPEPIAAVSAEPAFRTYTPPTARDYLAKGYPAPAAALAKDLQVADFLREKGITGDVFDNVSQAQRNAWGQAAGKSGISTTRYADISALLRGQPPTKVLTDETEAEILKFAQNEIGRSLQPAPKGRTLESNDAYATTGAAPQGIPVPQPPSPGGGPSPAPRAGTDGATTAIPVPGEGRTYAAQYRVRELADIQASHNGQTFQPNPDYSLTNDRDYGRPENRGKILAGAQQFDPRFLINDNPDATNGPPVLNSQGEALGGNGRTMILQRVYAGIPRAAQAYRDLLEAKAPQFGIDPADVQNFKQPVLVREIPDQELAKPQNAVSDFNKTGTAAMRGSERAIADSRRVSQGTLDEVGTRLEAAGPSATLSTILKGEAGPEILDRLVADGVITPQERAGLQDVNALTTEGQRRIASLLLARFFRDPAQLDSIPTPMRAKLERAAGPIARTESGGPWNLTPKIQEAVDLMEEARLRGGKIDDLAAQNPLSGEPYSPQAVTLANRLRGAKQRDFVDAVSNYSRDAAYAEQPNLFGNAPTQGDSFQRAFSRPGPLRNKAPAGAPEKSVK